MDKLLESIKEKALILKALIIRKEQLSAQHDEILTEKEELEIVRGNIENKLHELRENIDHQINEILKLNETKNEVVNFKQFTNYVKKKNLLGMTILMSLVALLSLPAILSSITAYLSIILSGIVILSSCYIPYYFDQTKDRRELKKMINLDALDIEIEDRVKQKEELEHDLIKLEKNNDSAKKDIEEIEKKENVLNNELLSIDDDKIELSKDIEQLLIMLVSNSEISEMANKNNAQDNSKVNLGSCKKICL